MKLNIVLKNSQKLYVLNQKVVSPSYVSAKMPSSVVAMHLYGNSLNTLHMNPTKVLDWRSFEIVEFKSEVKLNHVDLINFVQKAVDALPEVDVYLLEKHMFHSQASIKHAIWRTRLESTLVTLLHQKCATRNRAILYLKANPISRHFNVHLGGERTECISIGLSAINKTWDRNIDVPFISSDAFLKSEKLTQEHLSYCLMQAVYFYELLKEMDRGRVVVDGNASEKEKNADDKREDGGDVKTLPIHDESNAVLNKESIKGKSLIDGGDVLDKDNEIDVVLNKKSIGGSRVKVKDQLLDENKESLNKTGDKSLIKSPGVKKSTIKNQKLK